MSNVFFLCRQTILSYVYNFFRPFYDVISSSILCPLSYFFLQEELCSSWENNDLHVVNFFFLLINRALRYFGRNARTEGCFTRHSWPKVKFNENLEYSDGIKIWKNQLFTRCVPRFCIKTTKNIPKLWKRNNLLIKESRRLSI